MQHTDIVNLERYPLDSNADARQDLILHCRDALEQNAICCLPGFLTVAGLKKMIEEMQTLEASALRKSHLSTPYAWTDNSGFPEDHPRSAVFFRRFSYVLTDQIGAKTVINKLFEWDSLTSFVRDALGVESLYRSACPTLSIQLNYMHEGDVLPWHFDTNDGVVSLLLTEADEGGDFQVSPYVRDESDESYDKVSRVFHQDPALVEQPGMPAGTLILFKGRRSMHRVSPIGKTASPRMIVLYSYDEKPGMTFTEASQARMRDPDSTPYLGADTPADTMTFRQWKNYA